VLKSKKSLDEYCKTYRYVSRNAIDKFFDDDKPLLDWYIDKNPEFQKMNLINDGKGVEIPEFKILLATIAFTCIKILSEKKFPSKRKNNNSYYYNTLTFNFKFGNNSNQKKRFLNILFQINEMVKPTENGSIKLFYIPIINLCIRFEFDVDNISENNTNNENLRSTFNEYFNSPIIIYPTFNQISKLKVIRTMSAPILNCNINYTSRPVHGNSYSPIRNLKHDITFHGLLTHLYIYQHFNNNIVEYKQYYIELLEPFFYELYKKLKLMPTSIILDLIFHIFHEEFRVFYADSKDQFKKTFDLFLTRMNDTTYNTHNPHTNSLSNIKKQAKELVSKILE
jgi:hypothetical protein